MSLHRSTLLAAIAALICGISFGQAGPSGRVRFNIPQQPLGEALTQWSRQSGLQILRRDAEGGRAEEGTSATVSGEYTPGDALERLLSHSGLTYEFVNDHTVLVHAVGTATGASSPTAAGVAQDPPITRNSDPANSGSMRLAQAGQTDAGRDQAQAPSVEDGQHGDSLQLQEIVVTAQKRLESIQDTPVPVTVVNAEALTASNQLRVEDYYTRVPGLSLVSNSGQPNIAIRGLTTGGQANATVGIVVDDVSYGESINPGLTPSVPDIDPGDLARVEVLRGPQGTLYGASSLGGLLKYVTVDPSTAGLAGRLEVGMANVSHGGTGYNIRGSINSPLGDTVAVRVSGFNREEPGYVDNVLTGQNDINKTRASGGHGSLLWKPSEAFSLKLSALIQDNNRQGASEVDTSLGAGLKQSAMSGTGIYERKGRAYSATMAGRIAGVEWVSVTGYNIDKSLAVDDSPDFVAFANPPFSTATGAATPIRYETDKFTQEARASIPFGAHVNWLIGAFYTNENFKLDYRTEANDLATGAVLGDLLTIGERAAFDEYAGFTNLTVGLTDRLDVELGGRLSEIRQSFSAVRGGPLQPAFYPDGPLVPPTHGNDSAFTYLATPRFRISPDLMAYARLASGYRPGGFNANCTGFIPCQYNADMTRNYDLGLKGSVLDRRLTFDVAMYYIDWQDIQIPFFDPGLQLAYTLNAGEAKSRGVELSLEARPHNGLTVSGWVAWNDAQLARDFSGGSSFVGRSGDRLPYSSRYSGSLSLDQEFLLSARLSGTVGITLSYVGERKGLFFYSPRETFPAYTPVDIRAMLKYDTWSLKAYVNNLADRRGILNGGLDAGTPTTFTYIQPRTVGMSITKDF